MAFFLDPAADDAILPWDFGPTGVDPDSQLISSREVIDVPEWVQNKIVFVPTEECSSLLFTVVASTLQGTHEHFQKVELLEKWYAIRISDDTLIINSEKFTTSVVILEEDCLWLRKSLKKLKPKELHVFGAMLPSSFTNLPEAIEIPHVFTLDDLPPYNLLERALGAVLATSRTMNVQATMSLVVDECTRLPDISPLSLLRKRLPDWMRPTLQRLVRASERRCMSSQGSIYM